MLSLHDRISIWKKKFFCQALSSKEHNQSQSTILDKGKKLDALKEVGDTLRQARQKKNIDIKELAESLRIGEEQVTALEEALLERLPEEVYVNAMIRRISEKLELDSNPLIKKLRAPTLSEDDEVDEPTKTKHTKIKSINTAIFWIPIGSVICISLFAQLEAIQSQKRQTSPMPKQPLKGQKDDKVQYNANIEEANIINQSLEIERARGLTTFEEIQDEF